MTVWLVDDGGTANGGSDTSGGQQFTITVNGTLCISDVRLSEGNSGTTAFNFVVSLSAADAPVTLNLWTSDGTATLSDNDYQPLPTPTQITLGPGTLLTQTVPVPVNGDTKVELDETFYVNLSSLSTTGHVVRIKSQGVGTIVNDDHADVNIADKPAANEPPINEGNSGTTTVFNFTVTLTNPVDVLVTIDWATADGTATGGDHDYQPALGTLTFVPGGPLTQTVPVTVNGDDKIELNEQFSVNLSNLQAGGRNVTIETGKGTATGTITNDDGATISISDPTLPEGNSGTTSFVFTVNLSVPVDTFVYVDWATANGTATVADNDYQPDHGTVQFDPGETSHTVTVLVNGDTNVENDETFYVTLSNPQANGRMVIIGAAQATGTIINDDLSNSKLTGTVYLDADNDGSMTYNGISHAGIPGVTLMAVKTDTPAALPQTTMTDVNGAYQFDHLAAGTYQITETQPSQYIDGGNNTISNIVIGVNETRDSLNFRELGLQLAYISKSLYLASTPSVSTVLRNVDAAPVVDLNGPALGTGNDVTTSHPSVPVVLAPAATITDADSATLAYAVASISNLKDHGDEVLTADTSGTNIAQSYANGVLNLVGVDTVDNYQRVLRTIKYSNTATSPNPTLRLINFVVSDAVNRSEAATATLSDLPVSIVGFERLADLALESEDSWLTPKASV